MKRLLATLLLICLVVSSVSVSALAASGNIVVDEPNFDETKDATPVTFTQLADYDEYMQEHKNEPKGVSEIVIDASKLTSKTSGVKLLQNYNGRNGTSIYTGEEDSVEFTFNAKAGLYTVYIEYYTEPGKDVSAERALYINGKIPFDSVESFELVRSWKDKLDRDENGNLIFEKDIFGNGIVPTQIEEFKWLDTYVYDSLGGYSNALEFSFKDGANTLKLEAVKEPVTIGCIKLVPAKENIPYADYIAQCNKKGYKSYADEEILIEAESAVSKSDQTLYPSSDVSSASTSKSDGSQDAFLQSINYIGGTNWQYNQQRITWQVPTTAKAGLYAVNFKVRKNVYEGMMSSRKFLVNGEVPYKECEAIAFKFSSDWMLVSPQDDNGNNLLVYLEPGDEISLEVTPGVMGEILNTSKKLLNDINTIYRNIIMITGSSPDANRDYQLEKLIPDVIEEMYNKADEVTAIVDKIVDFTKKKGSDMSSLETLARQMKLFKDEPERIPKQLSVFKTNISAFGTWINNASNTPLEVDYISLSSPDKSPKSANANFLVNLGYQFNRFVSSFVIDYNAIGTLEEIKDQDKAVTVWIDSGRDQYQQLRALVNNSYTAKTGNQVNLELVNPGALLSAIVAGIGPDVALGQAKNEPVNYALRNALYDLTQFSDYKEVLKRFTDEAVVPYYFFDGKKTGLYALPEKQDFEMLFYRTDVLAELGIGIPNTWDQLIQCITVLNKNNMEFGMPQSVEIFNTMLMQYNGSMYTSDYKSTNLKTPEATKAFKLWTNFFVNYDCPKTFDFKNRFRTGEMPLGVAAFTLYNTLAVSAPEIRGLWGFTSMPGVVGEDGKINRSVNMTTACCYMIKKNKDYDLSWEFMKWWTDADTQSEYGKRLECVLGASARYNSANTEAFKKLPWTSEELGAIEKQRETAISLPEIAGSYFIGRHILNAFRKVVYNSKDPRDTLYDYSNVIDAEITKKRSEFGLPIDN